MRKWSCPARRSAPRTTARFPIRKFLRREVEAASAPPARLWGNCQASHFSVSFGPKFADHAFVLQSDGTDDYEVVRMSGGDACSPVYGAFRVEFSGAKGRDFSRWAVVNVCHHLVPKRCPKRAD